MTERRDNPAGALPPPIEVRGLELRYGDAVIQKDLDFVVNRRDVFVIMGGSGCGKSTLLRHLVGLMHPAKGTILYNGASFWDAEPAERDRLRRRTGVLYQQGALWSAMTLAENIALPLQQYTALARDEIADVVDLKLALVGLAGFGDYYPAELSGGMRKRAGLARAMALDPEILFFDEPSAGLDPVSARRLDELILELRNSLGATVVIVSHELASIFAIATTAVFLGAEAKTIIARGRPEVLREESSDPKVRQFLTRGGEPRDAATEKDRW